MGNAKALGAARALDQLERRRLFASFDGTSGNDTFVIEVVSPSIIVTINGVPNIVSDVAETEIIINALGGNDLIRYLSNGDNALTINGGNGSDTLLVGEGDLDGMNDVGGRPHVDLGGGEDRVIYDDRNESPSSIVNYSVQGNTFRRTKNGVLRSCTFVNEEHCIVIGTAADNIFNVNDLADTVSAAIGVELDGEEGNDTFRVRAVDDNQFPVLRGGLGDDVVELTPDAGQSARARLDASDSLASITVVENSTLRIVGESQVGVSAGSLQLSGALDMAGGYLLLRNGVATMPSLVTALSLGHASGNWNGVPVSGVSGAVFSSTAALSSLGDGVGYAAIGAGIGQLNLSSFRDTSVESGDLVLAYALNGDSNLDRDVNIADFAALASAFNQPVGWTRGNFNYDERTDLADFSALAANFGRVLPRPALPGLFSEVRCEDSVVWIDIA